MKTKLERLKTAYAKSPQIRVCDGDTLDSKLFKYMHLVEGLTPQLLEAADALKDLLSLVIEMGYEIRYLDDDALLPGYWTNDGEYIIDSRFRRATRALEALI